MDTAGGGIRRAQVSAADAAGAVRQLHDALARPDMALGLFFCSPDYALAEVAAEASRRFGDGPVIGCTTAGEIGPSGYRTGTISGVSFPSPDFAAAFRGIDGLRDLSCSGIQALVQDLFRDLDGRVPGTRPDNRFAFMMIDGLSRSEEPVARMVQAALGPVPLLGGSAGDGLDFKESGVYFDRRFHTDGAVLALVSVPRPCRMLISQNFAASDRRVVVTSADTGNRIVHELDGRPAAELYAELIGVDAEDLGPEHFAAAPLAVTIGGMNYVRSIVRALPEGGLQFFCAVEEGIVLRVTSGEDAAEHLEQTFAALRDDIGEPDLVIGCDCVLRRLDLERRGTIGSVSEILTRNRVVGFNTYGEQYRGIHVTQTFSGIAIGTGDAGND